MAKKAKPKKTTALSKKTIKIFLISFWGIIVVGVTSLLLLFVLIANGAIGYLPPIEELQNPKNKFASEIISSDGELIGTYFTAKDNRINTNYSELSPNLIKALVATEDERFTEHSGIDFPALSRVIVFRIILQQKGAGGGSTLTQQLAKQLYSPVAKNIFERALQKPIEWVIAVQLERLYTKEEILTMYLNKFDFLNNAVGIKTAAKVYFNKTPKELNVQEAATLIGMCKNPSLYNPASKRRKADCQERRNVVLSQMEKAGHITELERDSIGLLPIELDYQRVDHKLGQAPYFREYLRKMLTAKEPNKSNYASWQKVPYGRYYLDSLSWADNPLYGFCVKNKNDKGENYNIYNDGLKIYTTIDSRMQRYAEEAVATHFEELQAKFFKQQKNRKKAPYAHYVTEDKIAQSMNQAMKNTDRYRALKKKDVPMEEITKIFNTPVEMSIFSYDGPIDTVLTPMDSIRWNKHFAQCGMMSIDPKNGHVKAYVGGTDFSQFQYDMVNIGKRQIGSTVKPFLYTLAMSNGYWPCNTTINEPITLKDALDRDFTPRNSSNDRKGEEVTLKWGLQKSNNWITAYVMSLVTPTALVELMRSFGIKGHIDPVISICLGPCEVSVAEMVDAYTAFPNKGIRTEALYVTRIEDNNGNVIAEFTPRTEEVFNEETSYKMLDMLQAVMNGGTGIRVRYKYKVNAPAGGKTGTTQKNADGWFMGFTPSLVTGVWSGWEDRGVHFANMVDGQGASMALPVWALYMQKVLADKDLGYDANEQFDIPEEFNSNAGCGGATPVANNN